MTENPLVSVIINCYNGEKYLREAIDSVMAQTYDNWELVFWDNQSTDSTQKIVENYNSPKIRYFYALRHTPLGEARNLAMNKAIGDYLAFLDSDDIWSSDFLEKGVSRLISNDKAVGFYSNYYDCSSDRKVIHNKKRPGGSHSFSYILKYYGIGMSAAIVSRSVVVNNNIRFDLNYQLIEDLDFFLSILSYGDFEYEPMPLVIYRIHPNSSSFKLKSKWATEYDDICRKLLSNTYGRVSVCNEDLQTIRNKALYFKLEEKISENDRVGLLKLLINNKKYPLRYWIKAVYVIVGPKLYSAILKMKRHQ